MSSLFGPSGDGSAAIAAANRKQAARLAAEKQDIQQQEARRSAAGQRARMGGAGFRKLLTGGFRGVTDSIANKKSTLG
jgi:hypothetical protein